MKKLIIFYSFEGSTKLIAETIAQEIGADILELKPKKELPTKGFMKYIWGGRQLFMKKQPDLLPIDKNLNDYDLIFIGTPVWAWTFNPVLKSFLSSNKILNKKIALFCCHGGGKGKVFEKMKIALLNNEFIGQQDFCEPIKRNTEKNIKLAKIWAKGLAG